MKYYALFSDGGNCYSSYDDGHWYWTMSHEDEGQSKTDFRKSVKRMAENKAATNYREYVKSFCKVKIFESKDKFLKECEKVNIHPRLED